MNFEFRYVVPKNTSIEPPILQVRSCNIYPHWGHWEAVPIVAVSAVEFKAVKIQKATAEKEAAKQGVMK